MQFALSSEAWLASEEQLLQLPGCADMDDGVQDCLCTCNTCSRRQAQTLSLTRNGLLQAWIQRCARAVTV